MPPAISSVFVAANADERPLMNPADTEVREGRAEPCYMWAITSFVGRHGVRHIYAPSLRRTRAEAIREHVRVCGRTWLELRRCGDRCVRVLITEDQPQ